jgi:HAD superfamily phosphoserine phosphatase-like hydrolase
MEPAELIAAALEAGGTATFDADGTLWADDAGESFLRQLERDGLVAAGAWAEYERRHAVDAADAFGFAVTAMAGLREALVAERAASFFGEHFAPRVFPDMRELLRDLAAAGVRTAIVSASNRWVIEAGARHLGVARFAGISVQVEGGVLSHRLEPPLSTGTGKVAHARALLGGVGLAAGNGENDLPLLEAARVRLVVRPAGVETRLAAIARERGWLVREETHPCPGAALP